MQRSIISYHAVAVAAAVAAVAALIQHESSVAPAVPGLLLWVPVLSAPFAYAQYNEELMVRRMGAYIGILKQQLSTSDDDRYWRWDIVHAESPSWILWISGFFRGGITLLFGAVGMILGIAWNPCLSLLQIILVIVDLILLMVGAVIALSMWRVKLDV